MARLCAIGVIVVFVPVGRWQRVAVTALLVVPLVLIIGLFDLLTMGKVALSDPPWQSFSTEVYIGLAVIYIAFCFAMSTYSRSLERDLNRSRLR